MARRRSLVAEVPVKLILSRKGFDSGSGGCPSPILPDGTMVSLPIPLKAAPKTYDDIEWAPGRRMSELVRDLAPGRVKPSFRAHLDPDLRRDALVRPREWRPLFGQIDAAQSHLAKHGIGPGDLFLFFGLYRRVERRGDRYEFVRGCRSSHVLFGWLQIDTVHQVDTREDALAWACDHPHFHMAPNTRNAVYLSRRYLDLPGLTAKVPGAGVFPKYSAALALTAPDARGSSEWLLPSWFEPRGDRAPLSYHGRADRWTRDGRHVRLRSVGRGQEFVLDTAHYPEATPWLAALFAAALRT